MTSPGDDGRSPLIIGGTGGSGTRVVANIAQAAGVFIGTRLLDKSVDAGEFGFYSDRWVNAFLTVPHESAAAAALEAEMRSDLERVLSDHCAAITASDQPWGWKEPRSIFLLRFWMGRFPEFRFVHLVRDGRDMALSSNQNQLRKHGDALLGANLANLSIPQRSILLWTRLNCLAADFGEQQLKARYLRLRFEDLCARPLSTVGRLLDFLDLAASAADLSATYIAPPESLGRWRRESPDLLCGLEQIGSQGLRRFGYLD